MGFPKRVQRFGLWIFLPSLLVILAWGGIWLFEQFQVQTEGSVAILPSPVRPSPLIGGVAPLNEAKRLNAFVSYLSAEATYRSLYAQLKANATARHLAIPEYGDFTVRYQLPSTEPYTVQCRVQQNGVSDPTLALELTRLALGYLPHAYRDLFEPAPSASGSFIQKRLNATQEKWTQVVETLRTYQEKAGGMNIELQQALAFQTFSLLKALLGEQVTISQHLRGKSNHLLHSLGYRKKAQAYLAARYSRRALKNTIQTVSNNASSPADGLFPATNPAPKRSKFKPMSRAKLAVVDQMMRTDREMQSVNRRIQQMQTLLKRYSPAQTAQIQAIVEKVHRLEREKIALEHTQATWQTEGEHQQFIKAWGLQDEILLKEKPHTLKGLSERLDLWLAALGIAMLLGSGCALLKENKAEPRLATPPEFLSDDCPPVPLPEEESVSASAVHHISLDLPILHTPETFLACLQSPDRIALNGFNALIASISLSSFHRRIAISGNPAIAGGAAVALARQGEKVCLLELEGKTSQLQSLFLLNHALGLSELLQNHIALETLLELAKEDSPVENLTILPIGNAAALPGATQVRQLQSFLGVLENRFDRVILYCSAGADQNSASWAIRLQADQWLFCNQTPPKRKDVDALQRSLPHCALHWIQPA